MVPAHSIKVSRVSMYSGYRHVSFSFAYGAFTLSGRLSQNLSARIAESIMRSEPRNARIPVWPLSISLAATLEIDVSFSSSGYLDVSVHRVPFHTLCIGVWMTGLTSRVSPFRYLRIKDYLHLPAAFRSLSRLSSALSAKASTLRSFLLNLCNTSKMYCLRTCFASANFHACAPRYHSVDNFYFNSLKNFSVITMS